jgi:hypothetical protein
METVQTDRHGDRQPDDLIKLTFHFKESMLKQNEGKKETRAHNKEKNYKKK